jgi:Fe2+ or Zn2+ uptake regulation protein
MKNRNYKIEEIRNKNQKQILQALLTEIPLEDLMKQLKKGSPPIERSTLFRNLTIMEKAGLVKRIVEKENRHKRICKITSKGLRLLNELDSETKGHIFKAHVFSDIEYVLSSYADVNNLDDEKFSKLSKIITDLMFFVTLKSLEDTQNIDVLKLLDCLPGLLATRLKRYGYSTEQLKNHIDFQKLEDYYQESQIITSERYQKVVELFADFHDPEMNESIGDDFKKNCV